MGERSAVDFTPDRDRVADSGAEIPIIDISGFASDEEKRRAVVDAVRGACERIGFLVITGHGVQAETIARAFRCARAFFARPREEKLRIRRPGPGISRGYNSLASQSLGLTMGNQAPPDLMESLGFGPLEIGEGPYWREGYGPTHFHPNLSPDDIPGFREAVGDYWRAMEQLSVRLMRIFALALDLTKLLRRPQWPARHQYADQLLSAAARCANGRATAGGCAFGLWGIHALVRRKRAGRPTGFAPRRGLGRRADD